jgi:hypothetical protein
MRVPWYVKALGCIETGEYGKDENGTWQRLQGCAWHPVNCAQKRWIIITSIRSTVNCAWLEGMCQYDSFVDLDMDLTGSVDPDPGKPNCSTNKRKVKKLLF